MISNIISWGHDLSDPISKVVIKDNEPRIGGLNLEIGLIVVKVQILRFRLLNSRLVM